MVCALCVSAFVALAVPAVHQRLSAIDHAVRGLVEAQRRPTLELPMVAVSLLGHDAGLIPLITVASVVLWRAHRRWALALPLVMAGTGVLQWAAKWAVDRPRPNEAPWGFPSGHVLSLVVFFGVLTFLIWGSAQGRACRALGATFCGLLVLLVAYSRLYLGVHWFSDVVGGLLIGLAYLLAMIGVVGSNCGAGPGGLGRQGSRRASTDAGAAV